ncbi:MAG TPA: hypothetical protein VKW08_00475 [Xanthobacteraceae bacterium]|jgi:hypothetical protein|nr:hypothetical protein [Xanthobacteraceae bacterium]
MTKNLEAIVLVLLILVGGVAYGVYDGQSGKEAYGKVLLGIFVGIAAAAIVKGVSNVRRGKRWYDGW